MPMPKMCPRLVVPSTAPIPKPPKNWGLGMAGPAEGTLMVALPIAIATTLQTIITRATLGDQVNEAGAMARSGASIAGQ